MRNVFTHNSKSTEYKINKINRTNWGVWHTFHRFIFGPEPREQMVRARWRTMPTTNEWIGICLSMVFTRCKLCICGSTSDVLNMMHRHCSIRWWWIGCALPHRPIWCIKLQLKTFSHKIPSIFLVLSLFPFFSSVCCRYTRNESSSWFIARSKYDTRGNGCLFWLFGVGTSACLQSWMASQRKYTKTFGHIFRHFAFSFFDFWLWPVSVGTEILHNPLNYNAYNSWIVYQVDLHHVTLQ